MPNVFSCKASIFFSIWVRPGQRLPIYHIPKPYQPNVSSVCQAAGHGIKQLYFTGLH